MKYIVEVKDGKIHNPKNKNGEFPLDDGTYVIEVLKGRTEQQNKFYWANLTIISMETGDTPEELHELFRKKFLNNESTTDMTPAEFVIYMEKIRAEVAEFGIVLPEAEIK